MGGNEVSSGWFRNGFIYLLILVAVVALFFSVFSPSKNSDGVSLTKLARDIKSGVVKKIVLTGDELKVWYKDIEEPVSSRKEHNTDLT
jgi:cell division protease FtsH